MSNSNEHKEIRRVRNLLQKMADMAEHVEHTGSFASGASNYVKRYNAIVEHLEENEHVPEDLFPQLDEDDTDFGQLGAEARLLSEYLEDAGEEQPSDTPHKKAEKKGFDPGILVALAPFLGSNELSNLVRRHFEESPKAEQRPSETKPTAKDKPDLKTLVGLAPFVDKATLGQLVRTALAQEPLTDPQLLVALAPHMDKEEFGMILHEYLPAWFGEQNSGRSTPQPPSTSDSPGSWLQTLGSHSTETGL